MMRTISWMSAAMLLTALPHAKDAKPQALAPAHNTMVLTGCLMAGADDATFNLTKASRIEPSVTAHGSELQPAIVGTSGQSTEYELKPETALDAAGGPVDLKTFVGHQVEITARPIEQPPSPAPKAGEAIGTPDPSKPV